MEPRTINLGDSGEITVQNGEVLASLSVDLPQSAMQENAKYPYTPWQVEYQQKQIVKDVARLAQSVSNFLYVSGLVESRGGTREANRTEKTIANLTAKLAAAQAKLDAHNAASAPTVGA